MNTIEHDAGAMHSPELAMAGNGFPPEDSTVPMVAATSIIDTTDMERAREAIEQNPLYQGILLDPPHTPAELPEYTLLITGDNTLQLEGRTATLTNDQVFVLNLLLINRGKFLKRGDFITAGFRAGSRSEGSKDSLLARARKQLTKLEFSELGPVVTTAGETARDKCYGLDPRVVFDDQRETSEAVSVKDMSQYEYPNAHTTASITDSKRGGQSRMPKGAPKVVDPTDPVRLYLDEIGRTPLLTRDDEIRLAQVRDRGIAAQQKLAKLDSELHGTQRAELLREITEGDEAKKRFIEANLRLAVSVAKKFQASGVPLLDLIQFGNDGLMHAVDKFEWQRGFKFSTYATWWIRQAIGRGIAKELRLIQLPINLHEKVGRLRREIIALENTLNREPTVDDIAASLHMTPGEVSQLLALEPAMQFIDAPLSEDSSSTHADMIADPRSAEGYEGVEQDFVRQALVKALSYLDQRERDVLSIRFGLDDGQPKSLEAASEILRLNRESIRQAERRGLAKLRHPAFPTSKLLEAML